MTEPLSLGWQVLDPDGNVVESGEVTIVEAHDLDEIAEFLAATHPEGAPSWPA